MSKRNFRKALVLAAAGVLVSPVVASVADAQTVVNPQSTVTASATFVGPVPSGVSGVNVTVHCKNLILAGTTSPTGDQTYTASIPTSGGTGVMNFNLTSIAPGSSCSVKAEIFGTANLNKGAISIAVGGTTRTVVATTPAVAGANAVITGSTTTESALSFLPVQVSTTVVVTVTHPSITVKKVVSGDEPVAGFAYPMTLACSDTRTAFFTSQGLTVNGAGTWVTIPGPITGTANGGPFGDIVAAGSNMFLFDRNSTSTAGPTIGGGDAALIPVAAFFSTDGTLISFNSLANQVNLDQASTAKVLAALNAAKFSFTVSPVGGTGFNGSLALKGGESKTLGVSDLPLLSPTSVCEATELNNQGGVTGYSSTQPNNADGTTNAALPGVQAGAVFKSALTRANGQTITVTNSFYGYLIISKVVTGDPKTNIGTFEISVACDKGGPKDTFLLKDRQSKWYSNIAVGTNCLVTETRSDGAIASYSDNSGDNTTDGRVTIKSTVGCAAPGAPTAAAPGGPSPVTTVNVCDANVIVTNDYNPPATTTTAAPATTATTAAPAAPATTAAPAVAAEPAQAVEETPTFTG